MQLVRTARYKLYADRRFFDTERDPLEQTPIAVEEVPASVRPIHEMLKRALARHAQVIVNLGLAGQRRPRTGEQACRDRGLARLQRDHAEKINRGRMTRPDPQDTAAEPFCFAQGTCGQLLFHHLEGGRNSAVRDCAFWRTRVSHGRGRPRTAGLSRNPRYEKPRTALEKGQFVSAASKSRFATAPRH